MNNILTYLTYEDGILTDYIYNICAIIVSEKQCQEFCYSFTCLKKVFQVRDSFTSKRVIFSIIGLRYLTSFNRLSSLSLNSSNQQRPISNIRKSQMFVSSSLLSWLCLIEPSPNNSTKTTNTISQPISRHSKTTAHLKKKQKKMSFNLFQMRYIPSLI